MIEGKILWLEPEDKDTAAQEAEAHVVIKDGRMVKNRFGAIAPNEEAEKALKRKIHVQLVSGALSGPLMDFEDGQGPVHCIDRLDTISQVCADGVDTIMQVWREREWL
jgi:hypothetical protein